MRTRISVVLDAELVTRLDVALARNQAAARDPTESRSTLIQAAVLDWLAQGEPATPEEMREAEEQRAKRFGCVIGHEVQINAHPGVSRERVMQVFGDMADEIEKERNQHDHRRMARIWVGG